MEAAAVVVAVAATFLVVAAAAAAADAEIEIERVVEVDEAVGVTVGVKYTSRSSDTQIREDHSDAATTKTQSTDTVSSSTWHS
jgi:hypothetical protein